MEVCKPGSHAARVALPVLLGLLLLLPQSALAQSGPRRLAKFQWRHKRTIRRLLEEEQPLSWPLLMSTGDFSRDDSLRLAPYMPF